ncbi:MAG: glycine--tRNA ligase [Candidatus Marinimicrobia bacterium]|nr:glycine--tRNA ligase [Candidatus Neomarinimicrobiota bacterium]MBL7022955.1 glycine--tRNA ligase [Candidatus Neomarinimicrobiota bacterium]MBL7108773.1 glycine--tRNA ligase [Candidatus Neomarinimicrobiota bacterium]
MANIKSDGTILETLTSLSKQRGFIFQSSEVYGGLGSTWDYGPLGVELKRNVKNFWWQEMVTSRENIVGMDAAILMHPKVWEASGHIDNFHDPLVDNKESKKRYRMDHLLEEQPEEVIEKLLVKFYGDTIPKFADDEDKFQSIVGKLNENQSNSAEALVNVGLIDPHTKKVGDWTNLRQFNLMFKTHMGPTDDSASVVYLRPETAQGIFVNFPNVQSTSRQKLPFGIAQLGKAFRNEITTGNFIFRTREFEQMEMEFFCRSNETGKWLEYWSNERLNWFKSLGINESKLRLRPHGSDELAHYSTACYDVEYKFDFGWSELEGIADRGTFDLDQHAKFSGKKMTYFDQPNNENIIPAVVETSAGVDRAVLTILADAFTEEEVNGEKRTVLKFSPKVAPTTVAVFPLMNKGGQPEKAQTIVDELRKEFSAFYDAGGSIGRRYRRQDEAGTPFGITVDHDTMDDDTVTLRDRDTMQQVRVGIDKVRDAVRDRM